MTEISQRIANLSAEQRTLLEKCLGGSANAVRAREPIAIVGAACRIPGGANDLDAFWRMLRSGVDGVSLVPRERWNADALFDPDPAAAGRITSRWGGFIADVDQFDAAFFGISPREAVEMDPQQRILLEVAYDALDNAGTTREQLTGSRMGIFVGAHGQASDYMHLQCEDLDELDSFSGTGSALNLLAGRLSYLLDTHGPAVVIDTACSSSLVALHLAVQSLRAGESSSALVGGVNLILTPICTIVASRMHMLAPDGRCKAFDRRADGFVRSEGCGVVVLKTLADAIAGGDAILAVIRGSAVNQDGHTNGITAPNGLAQRRVIEHALADAGVAGAQIGYVEAHGTGTALGDPIEIEALGATIGRPNGHGGPCFVGAVKTNIGHLEGAAGIAGLIKAALVLQHSEIPPNLHFTTLNPHIKLTGTRLKLPQSVEAWPQTNAPRRAAVSSFGWSGTNAHVILEEAPASAARAQAPAHDLRIVPISAYSPEALAATARRLGERLRAEPPINVDDLSFTAATRRTHHACRLAVIGRTAADLANGIDAALAEGSEPAGASGAPRIAFVFPGHGAQWAGMGQALLRTEPVFRDAIARCDEVIRAEAGWSLLEEIAAPAAASRFGETEIAQPALFAFGVALAELWASWGIKPDVVVGHSMGEVAAAHVAGALSLADATRIICRRSRLLQQVADRGGMLLVELSEDEAGRAIAGFEDVLSIGAVNGPRSTVLGGDHGALDKIAATLTAREVFCRAVKGSPPGHSPLVEGFGQTLLSEVASVVPRVANVPFYSTVTASRLSGERLDAKYWARNLREPVQFLQAVRALLRDGVDTLIEMSPHQILSSVVHDIAADESLTAVEADAPARREVIALGSLRRDEDDHEVLYGSLGRLYERGAGVRWAEVAPRSGKAIALPGYAWQRARYWLQRSSAHRDAVASDNADVGQRPAAGQSDVTEWLYEAAWSEAPQPRAPGGAGRWIVLTGGNEASAAFAAALDAMLSSAGGRVHVICSDDSAAALEVARAHGTPWSGIIQCAALDATPTNAITVASLSADPVPGVRSLLSAIRSLDAAAWKGEPMLWIVTRGATAVYDADRAGLAIAQAPMTGLARVVQAEHPTRFAAWVDIDPSAALAEQATALAAELARSDDEPAVAMRGGRRYVQRLAPLAAPAVERAVTFRGDASYLITGGLGGIGLFVARWMIAKGARHLLITGRTPLPPRSQWRALELDAASPVGRRVAAIRELEALGASVHYVAADIADAEAMSAVLAQWHADAQPPIRGCVHSAVVAQSQLLSELELQSIDRVFRAKAIGAWLLHSTIAEMDWLVLFSSLLSILRYPGDASYTAANSFVDALAQYRRGKGQHALSVGWGLWTEIGLGATVTGRESARLLAERGIHGFSPADGLRALDELLVRPVAHAAVLNADRAVLAAQVRPPLGGFPASRSDIGKADNVSVAFAEQLRRADAATIIALLRQRIARHVEAVLKLENVRLDMHKPLGEYGLNSIMGLELRYRLERDLALRLPTSLVYNYPSVAAMAEHLQGRLNTATATVQQTGHPGREPQRRASQMSSWTSSRTDRVAELEKLSDDAALVELRASKSGANQ